jgi:hypothetical protein
MQHPNVNVSGNTEQLAVDTREFQQEWNKVFQVCGRQKIVKRRKKSQL